MILRAALVDMDGTIWVCPVRMADVRRELGLPEDGRPILAAMADLPPRERRRANRALCVHEARAVEQGTLRPGTIELLGFLRRRGLRCVLVTNNSRQSADAVLARHALPFDLVCTRDNGALKPDPRAFLLPLARLGGSPSEAIVLGDSHFDLQAAHAAGIGQVILVAPPASMRPDFPPGVTYHEVPDLPTAQTVVEGLL